MYELIEVANHEPIIKVVGVGGGGGNAIESMLEAKMEGVTLININTDAQTLSSSKAGMILQIGENLTKGLGAGANPEIGRYAAEENIDRITEAIKESDLVFIAAGMGGGTGTGAAPVIAKLAKDMNILTVAVVTRPFPCEGAKRMRIAERGIEELREHVDSIIVIPNEKILTVMGQTTPIIAAFQQANEVLRNAVQGIAELITRPGLINVDFADVRTVMSEMGTAMMGAAVASGEDRASEAAHKAISSPLLENVELRGAKGVLVNITAADITMGEYETAATIVNKYAAADATLVMGATIDPNMGDELRFTVVATGLVEQARETEAGQETAPPSAQPEPTRVAKLGADKRPPHPPQMYPFSPKNAPQWGNTRANPQWRDGKAKPLDLPEFLRRQADAEGTAPPTPSHA